jgi:hypothetical protein
LSAGCRLLYHLCDLRDRLHLSAAAAVTTPRYLLSELGLRLLKEENIRAAEHPAETPQPEQRPAPQEKTLSAAALMSALRHSRERQRAPKTGKKVLRSQRRKFMRVEVGGAVLAVGQQVVSPPR